MRFSRHSLCRRSANIGEMGNPAAGWMKGAGLMIRKPEGPANWKIATTGLTTAQCEQRWWWLTPKEEQRFEDLADHDEGAYVELFTTIEAATGGLLPVDQTGITTVNHPLNKNLSKKWKNSEVPWIGEWKADSTIKTGVCYRVFFTDALEVHHGIPHQMIALLFREYPDKNNKDEAQSRDIDRAISLAKKHQKDHHCVLRTMELQ